MRPLLVSCLGLVCAIFVVSTAHAAFPGTNGKIAFYTGEGIDTINPDGTGRARFAAASSPAWSADGTRLAFVDGDDGGHVQIFWANADGSNRTQVTSGQFEGYGTPAWSPDGQKIVFNRGQCFLIFCIQGISTVNSDGTERRDLAHDASTPNWSPDGTKIAFTGEGTVCYQPDPNDPYNYTICNAQIFTINPDNTGYKRITDDTTSDYDPNWSPDGTKIAFTSTRDGNPEIYVMNADGTGQRRLTHDPAVDATPAWSPDGTKIAFTSGRDEPNPSSCGQCDHNIYVMNEDGTGETRLTDTPLREIAPDWQPLPGPQRSDYKNAAQFCKALRESLGDEGFRTRYGGGANAHGKCVSGDGR